MLENDFKKTYDDGIVNQGVRGWFYLQRGLNLVNEFKYLIAGILAVYYTLQLDSYKILIFMFVISVPILTFVGWFHTHKMAKALEWRNMVFSSYFARHNVDLAEQNVELLEKILNKLNEYTNAQNGLVNSRLEDEGRK